MHYPFELRMKKKNDKSPVIVHREFFVSRNTEKLLNIRRGLQKMKLAERVRAIFFLKSNILEIKFRRGATSRAVGCTKHAYARAHV